MSIIRLEADPGLLTNRLMSLEIGVGLATLTGRRLSMPWSRRIGESPGPRPAGAQSDHERPTVHDLWEIPIDIVSDEEWDDVAAADTRLDLEWDFCASVYLADDGAIPDPGVIDFANRRTRFVRIPDTDVHVVAVAGRPLAWYSYFFHATGLTRRRLLAAIGGIRLRLPFR